MNAGIYVLQTYKHFFYDGHFQISKARSSQAWWYSHLESQHMRGGGSEASLTAQQLHCHLVT